MATLAATDLRPRRLVIDHLSLTIEGRTLEDVQLGGWVYGPELGTAPAVADRRRHHRVAVSVRRRPVGRRRSARGVVAGAVRAGPDRSREVHGAVPVVARQRLDVAGLRRSALARKHLGGRPGRSRRRVARRLRLQDSGDLDRRQPRRHGRRGLRGAASRALREARSRSPPACVPTAGARRRATCSASSCATACATATSRPGMMRARQLGMLTYRGRDELDTRFGKLLPHLERPPVAEYLDHHGRRFAERFPVKTFLLLSESIDRESMGDAQAVREACARVNAETIVVGVPGDMLFPWALQVELHRALQAAGADSSLWKLESLYGHDAFLADQDKLADLLRGAGAFGKPLKTASRPRFEGVGVEPVREIRIGLVGCGTVGRGLLEMIDRQSDADRRSLRRQVPRVTHRGARRRRRIADRGPPAFRSPIARSSSSAIPKSTWSSRPPAAPRSSRSWSRRSPPANPSSPRTRSCSRRSSPSSACWRSGPKRRSTARPRPPRPFRSSGTSVIAPTKSTACGASSTPPATSS